MYVGDQVIGQDDDFRTMTGHFSLCGRVSAWLRQDAASKEYAGSRFDFPGGVLTKVVFDVADDAYIDIERHLAAAIARD